MVNRKTYADKRSAVRGAKQLGLNPETLDFVQRDGRWTWAVDAHPADDVPEVQANAVDEEDDADWHRKAAEADAVGRQEAVRAAAQAQENAAQRASGAAAFETVTITPETRQPPEPIAPVTTPAAPITLPPTAPSASGVRPDGLRAGTKLALLADTICRPTGATHDELCQVVGWSACLPMAMKACEKAEISLRRQKEGRLTRYFGTPKER